MWHLSPRDPRLFLFDENKDTQEPEYVRHIDPSVLTLAFHITRFGHDYDSNVHCRLFASIWSNYIRLSTTVCISTTGCSLNPKTDSSKCLRYNWEFLFFPTKHNPWHQNKNKTQNLPSFGESSIPQPLVCLSQQRPLPSSPTSFRVIRCNKLKFPRLQLWHCQTSVIVCISNDSIENPDSVEVVFQVCYGTAAHRTPSWTSSEKDEIPCPLSLVHEHESSNRNQMPEHTCTLWGFGEGQVKGHWRGTTFENGETTR